MNLLFRKKPRLQALADVLEDGLEITNREMKKMKYNQYQGAEPMVLIAVRVQSRDEPPLEVKMKTGISLTYLLKPGVQVQVKYSPGGKGPVILDDDLQSILERNPQLFKKL